MSIGIETGSSKGNAEPLDRPVTHVGQDARDGSRAKSRSSRAETSSESDQIEPRNVLVLVKALP